MQAQPDFEALQGGAMSVEDFSDEPDAGVEPLEAEEEEDLGVEPLDAESEEAALEDLEDEWEDEEAQGAAGEEA